MTCKDQARRRALHTINPAGLSNPLQHIPTDHTLVCSPTTSCGLPYLKLRWNST
jgi:hypothetical protein